jgi:hypothetical protein
MLEYANRLIGDELDSADLATLLDHEIGHTVLGSEAIGQFPHDVFQESDIAIEEIRAVEFFENPYRKFYGLPLRCSYLSVGDVSCQ